MEVYFPCDLTAEEVIDQYHSAKSFKVGFDACVLVKKGELARSFRTSDVSSSMKMGICLDCHVMLPTEAEFMKEFKIPSSAAGLKTVTLPNEEYEPTKFVVLANKDKKWREGRLFSIHEVDMKELFLDRTSQLRQEQAADVYNWLLKDQVGKRFEDLKASARRSLPDENDIRAKCAEIIKARQEAEQNQDESDEGDEPRASDDDDDDDETGSEAGHADFHHTAAVKLTAPTMSMGSKPQPVVTLRSKGGNAGGKGTKAGPKSKAKSGGRQSTAAASQKGGSQTGKDDDGETSGKQTIVLGAGGGPKASPCKGLEDLCAAITAKVGSTAQCIKNLDVPRILSGEKLGRSMKAAPCQNLVFFFLSDLDLDWHTEGLLLGGSAV